VAQSIKHPTLGFGSGSYLMPYEISPELGSMSSGGLLGYSLPLTLPTLRLSLKSIFKKNKGLL